MRSCATASSTVSTGPRSPRARARHGWSAATAGALADGGTAEDALWPLWSGTDWPLALRARVELRRAVGARLAHRDLDAVVALFDAAAREAEKRRRSGHRPAGVRDFLVTPASPSRSRPTPWPSRASAATPCAC